MLGNLCQQMEKLDNLGQQMEMLDNLNQQVEVYSRMAVEGHKVYYVVKHCKYKSEAVHDGYNVDLMQYYKLIKGINRKEVYYLAMATVVNYYNFVVAKRMHFNYMVAGKMGATCVQDGEGHNGQVGGMEGLLLLPSPDVSHAVMEARGFCSWRLGWSILGCNKCAVRHGSTVIGGRRYAVLLSDWWSRIKPAQRDEI